MIRIVTGLGQNKNILLASQEANKIEDLEVSVVKSEKQLFESIISNDIDAVVRGSFSSHTLMKMIKDYYDKPINRATYIKHKTANESYEFLISPVGIDEANSIEDKVILVIQSCQFLNSINLKPKIAILSNGRKDDYGRDYFIDKSLKDSEELYKLLVDNFKIRGVNDITIKKYYILLEKAIQEKNNLILFPNGVIGNYIFRSLVLLNSWNSYGAIALGIDDIFIDTSRDQSIEGYLRSLKLAYQIAKSKKLDKNLKY
jgi:putative methanogen marker protein 4